MKEIELLRAESLQCIGTIRRLTIFVTSIAGAGVPLIAAVLKLGPNSATTIGSEIQLEQAITENSIVLQIICLSIATACTAFMHLYLGIFRQIFILAAYIRDRVAPKINEIAGFSHSDDDDLFQWEAYLTQNRARKAMNIGDIDISTELFLMAIYSLFYAAIAIYSASLGEVGGILIYSIIFLISANIMGVIKFNATLRANVKQYERHRRPSAQEVTQTFKS